MIEELMLFKELRSAKLGVSDFELVDYVESELRYPCPELKEALCLGVDPVKGHGVGRIDKRFWSAMAIARNREESIRVRNNAEALRRGNPSDNVTAFRSAGNPYVLAKVKAWHEKIHHESPVEAEANPGFQAGRDLRSALLAQANAAKNGGNQTYAG